MTRRQQIVNALDARLKSILVINGYGSDLGTTVSAWRTRPMSPTEEMALVYRDTTAPKTAAEVGRHAHTLTVEMSLVVQDDTPAETVRDLIADIVAAIGSDPRFGGLARWSTLVSDELTVMQDSGHLAGAALTWEITYTTELWEV